MYSDSIIQEDLKKESLFIMPEESYYDETDIETAEEIGKVGETVTSANFQHYDAVRIPHNVAELFKDFNKNMLELQAEAQQHSHDNKIESENLARQDLAQYSAQQATNKRKNKIHPTIAREPRPQEIDSHDYIMQSQGTGKIDNYGAIILNENTLANLYGGALGGGVYSNTASQEHMDDVLAHALDPSVYGTFSHSNSHHGIVTGSSYPNRNKNPYYNLQLIDGEVKKYLSQIILPSDSLADITAPSDLDKITDVSAEQLNLHSSKNFAHPTDILEDSSLGHIEQDSLSIEEILQIPYEQQFITPVNLSPSDREKAKLELATLEEKMVKTDFFNLYDEKESAQDNIMWDSSHDSIAIYGTHVFDDSMDCWADFDIETDWIDISFFLGHEYTFEVVNGNHGSTIVIKNAQGVVVQGMTVANGELSYPLVYAMLQHIRNPLLEEILSLGERFGIFAIDDRTPWFSRLCERPNATEFFTLQQRLQEIQEKYHLKYVKPQSTL